MMVFATPTHPSPRTQGKPAGDLCLRIVGSERDGQVVRLSAARCTIGSAEGSTLRLRARGVRPMHLLVLRGAAGTVARAWDASPSINGQVFRDTWLVAGDRLSIGPVEFEVLASPEVQPEDAPDPARTLVLDRPVRSCKAGDGAPEAGLARPVHRRQRVRRLVAEVRKLRAQLDSLASSSDPPAEAKIASDELQHRLDAYKLENQQWETTLQDLQASLNQREQQLGAELADLERARRGFDDERQRWEAECAALRRESEENDGAYRQAQEELRVRHADFERTREQACAELAAARDELERQRRELLERTGVLERREAALAESEAAKQAAAAEIDERRAAMDAQQAAAWRELEEQRAAAAELETAHREALATVKRQAEELAAARREADVRRQEIEAVAADHVAARDELERQKAQFAAEVEQTRLQLEADRQSWQASRAEVPQISREAQAEIETLRAELETATRALTDREARLAELEAERRARESDHQTAGDELQRRIAELDEREQRLLHQAEIERRNGDAQAELEGQLAQRKAALDARQAQLDEDLEQHRKALEDERSEIEAQRSALQQQQEAFQHECEQTLARLEGEARQLQQQREELQSEDEAFEVGSPVQQNGVLDSGPQTAPETARAEAEETLRERPPAANEDEESIEACWAAMLKKYGMGAQAGPVASPPPQPQRNKRKSDAPPLVTESAEAHDPPPVPVLDLPLSSGELRPHTIPATKANVTPEMRELANVQARTAIDAHGQWQSLKQAYSTLGVSLVCFAMAFIVWLVDGSSTRWSVSMGIVIVGIALMTNGIVAAGRVARLRKKRHGLRAMLEEVEAQIVASQAETETKENSDRPAT